MLGGPLATRRHVTVSDPATGATTHIQVRGDPANFPAGLLDTVTGHLLALRRGWADAHPVFVFSGSLPPTFPPDTYQRLAAALQV